MASNDIAQTLREAHVHVRNQHWAEAAAAAMEVLAEAPDQYQGLTILVLAKLELGEYHTGTVAAGHMTRIEPSNPLGFYMLALGLAADGQLDASLDVIRECLHLDPNEINFLNLMCDIQLALKDAPGARDTAEYMVRRHPRATLAQQSHSKAKRTWFVWLRKHNYFSIDIRASIANVEARLGW